MSRRVIDIIGQRFGKLLVIDRSEDHIYPNGRHDLQYKCKCDCGTEVVVLGIHLRSGHVKSCGCYRRETTAKNMATHKMTNTRIYAIWKNMKQRCSNPNRKDYSLYGGRGISVCKEWINNFNAFLSWSIDSGYDNTLSLDRIDVNGDYEPKNCRWVTQKKQCNNTRRNIIIEMDGEIHTLKEWCEILGKKYSKVSCRVRRGWEPSEALRA